MAKTRRGFPFQLLGLAAGIALLFVAARFFHLLDLIVALQERVVQWGPWSAACYPVLFALCNILLLPGGILCVGSGFFYGLWWGFFLVFVGNAIGAAVSFAITRSAGQAWFREKLSRYPLLRTLEPAVEREGWKIILLSQLHPLFPTSLINYFYGLTKIPFRTYMIWVSVGRAPGLFLYVYLGTLGQLGLNLARGRTHPRAVEYWTWGGLFVVSALLLIMLSRMASRAVRARDEMRDGAGRAGNEAAERTAPV